MEQDINLETIPDFRSLRSSWRKINISMINVMMDEVYDAGHRGGGSDSELKIQRRLPLGSGIGALSRGMNLLFLSPW